VAVGAYSNAEEFRVRGIAYAMPEFCEQYAHAREGMCGASVETGENDG
jgi:hypothetical protein